MEISKEVAESLNLTEDQIKGVSEFGKGHIAELQKEWDSKANENAQNILNGVVGSLHEKTGFKLDRNQGEKHADYLSRYSSTYLEKQKGEIESLKSDYETKLKEFKGGDALKSELDAAKSKMDEALKKYADYDEVKAKAEKADNYEQELSGLKLQVAFNSNKPSFPDTVNTYEAKAKWDEFQKKVLDENIIEIVDGEAMAVSKDNKYKTAKLSDIIAKDEIIQGLVQGRQQKGTGGKPIDNEKLEGVPFEVPKDADSATKSKLIRDYLATEGIKPTDSQYSKKFSELNAKIREAKKAS